MKYRIGLTLAAFLTLCGSLASASERVHDCFGGYELTEMAMNKFRNYALEFGCRTDKYKAVRVVAMDVVQSEAHLASPWQSMGVDGPNVTGQMQSYALNYDHFIGKRRRAYWGPIITYSHYRYQHTISSQSVDQWIPELGIELGYRISRFLGVPHLYVNASVPFRFMMNPLHERVWDGETTINEHIQSINLWLFLGLEF